MSVPELVPDVSCRGSSTEDIFCPNFLKEKMRAAAIAPDVRRTETGTCILIARATIWTSSSPQIDNNYLNVMQTRLLLALVCDKRPRVEALS